MKNFLFTICMLVFMMVSVSAQQTQTKDVDLTPAITTEDPATPAPGPVMEFEATEVDYGEIEQGSDPYRFFRFTNTGDAPLVIQRAKGSCGCTVPTYPHEPILPGESGEIKVRYDTKRVGPFTKYVTLTTNVEDEKSGKVQLKISGKVNKAAEEAPAVPAEKGGLFNGGGK